MSVPNLSESAALPSAGHPGSHARSYEGALQVFVVGLTMILLLSRMSHALSHIRSTGIPLAGVSFYGRVRGS